MQALQKGKYQVLGAGESRVRRRAGAARGGRARSPASRRPPIAPVFYVGYLLTIARRAAAQPAAVAGARPALLRRP